MKHRLKKIIKKNKSKPSALENKKITSDNIALHREEVLGSARKYIYPLRHSKHRLVTVSISLISIAIIAFFAYSALALYKFKTTSNFIYQVTKVVPYPLARIGTDFVSYESYLFEVKRYMHYYRTQQSVDFSSDSGSAQLKEYKKRAQQKVINDAYVKDIADQKGISVSDAEINDEITVYRNQNRLGSDDKELKKVIHEFFDWSLNDFKRSLKQQILTEKVVTALDTDARQKAEAAQSKLRAGKDFAELAREVSEDPATKQNGGNFGFEIDRNNRDISPKTVTALFNLKPGQTSDTINIGYGLEIVKNIEQNDDKIKAAHIVFNFKDISEYLGEIKDKKPARTYVTF